MNEGIPHKILIDKKAQKRDSPDSLEKMKNRLYSAGYFGSMSKTLERMRPSFEDFFSRVITEEPDYIILLDKGARPFGAPFERYLNTLNLKKKPKVVFWNDDTYKGLKYKEDQEKISQEYEKRKDLHGKKLFFVDEMYFSGHGAHRLERFFDKSSVDGQYFAFSYVPDSNYGDEEIGDAFDRNHHGDDRFHLYRLSHEPNLFTKDVARLYVTDHKNSNSDIETTKRFEYVDADSSSVPSEVSQEELEKMKKFADDTRRQTSDAIYKTLQELDLSKIGELKEEAQYNKAA